MNLKPVIVTLTEEEYRDLCESSSGVCKQCGEVRYGDTEPDAENYPCGACDAHAVVGIENALIDGTVDILVGTE